MLNSFPFAIFIGTLLGFLAGLGIGGGSLLILWLTLFLEFDPAAARSINLMFFLPAALISSWFRLRRGYLPLKQVLPAIIAGCICAAAASCVGSSLDLPILKKLFGFLLLFTGLRELLYKTKHRV